MLNSTVSKQENGKLSVERTCPALVLPPMQEEARVALARLSVLLLRKGSRRGGGMVGGDLSIAEYVGESEAALVADKLALYDIPYVGLDRFGRGIDVPDLWSVQEGGKAM